ncbi:MAG: deoxyribonuclease V [Deltaproteobacteria bacterium]|nr:deoxyribonuclease V [Deltaproteobacteria bacterium]
MAIQFEKLKKQQEILRKKIILKDQFSKIKIIGGCDVSYRKQKDKTWVKAGIVLLTYPHLRLLESETVVTETDFPYVPGFLSFREIPPLKECYKLLKKKPDLLLVDGQGIAHFREFGLASHLGVVLDLPTIGCAKKRLVGEYDFLKLERGNFVPLYYKKKVVGRVVCTRDKVKPVFVSVGHKVSLVSATHIILKCSQRYRIPEPLRFAHQLVSGA